MKLHRLYFAFAALATLLAIVPASHAACSDATVVGVWGYQVGPGVGQFTADGAGHLTAGLQVASQNGVIVTQTYTGTYTVATNCTGSLTLNYTGGGSSHANFVLDNANKGAQIVATDTGVIASGSAFPQGACGIAGKKGIFAANLFGKINGTGPIAYLAQLTLNGTGKVTGTGTFNVNGVTMMASITGTYTDNSNCTGTIKITATGFGTLNFFYVGVSLGKKLYLVETDTNTIVAGNMQQ